MDIKKKVKIAIVNSLYAKVGVQDTALFFEAWEVEAKKVGNTAHEYWWNDYEISVEASGAQELLAWWKARLAFEENFKVGKSPDGPWEYTQDQKDRTVAATRNEISAFEAQIARGEKWILVGVHPSEEEEVRNQLSAL